MSYGVSLDCTGETVPADPSPDANVKVAKNNNDMELNNLPPTGRLMPHGLLVGQYVWNRCFGGMSLLLRKASVL